METSIGYWGNLLVGVYGLGFRPQPMGSPSGCPLINQPQAAFASQKLCPNNPDLVRTGEGEVGFRVISPGIYCSSLRPAQWRNSHEPRLGQRDLLKYGKTK